MNKSVPLQIAQQVSDARIVIERNLGAMLKAIHLFGSALDGGLKPGSDIDLMVTVSARLDVSVRHAFMLDLLAVSAPVGSGASCRPLEVTAVVESDVVPWHYPPRRELQFGEWLREDLLSGAFECAVPDHDLAILLTKVRQNSLALVGPPAIMLFEPVPTNDFFTALSDTIAQWNSEPDWHGDERNIVLALARIWYSATTGQVVPKDIAAAWLLGQVPARHRPVIRDARASYLGLAQDDLASRAGETTAFICYAKSRIHELLQSVTRGR